MSDQRDIFDDFLKDALEGAEGSVSSSDWSSISNKLDQMEAADMEFDANVKAATAGVEGEVHADDWNKIQSKLDSSKRRGIFWWSAAALLITIGLALYLGDLNTKRGNVTVVDEQNDILNEKGHKPEVSDIDQSNSEVIEQIQIADSEDANNSSVLEENDSDESTSPTPKRDLDYDNTDNGPEIVNDIRPQLIIPDVDAIALERLDPKYDHVYDPSELSEPMPWKREKIGETEKKSRKGNFELGVLATPNSGWMKSIANSSKQNFIHKDFFNILNESENRARGYRFGINVNYQISDRFYLGSGLYYSQKVESVDYDYVITERLDFDEKAGIRDYLPLPSSLYKYVDYDGINTLNFVEIPVKIGTIVSLGTNSDFELRVETGFSFMSLTSARGKKPDQTFLELYEMQDYSMLRSVAVGWEAKGGLYWTPGDFWRFGLEPGAGITLSSLYNNESPTKLRPYNFGLNITANYLIFNTRK